MIYEINENDSFKWRKFSPLYQNTLWISSNIARLIRIKLPEFMIATKERVLIRSLMENTDAFISSKFYYILLFLGLMQDSTIIDSRQVCIPNAIIRDLRQVWKLKYNLCFKNSRKNENYIQHMFVLKNAMDMSLEFHLKRIGERK